MGRSEELFERAVKRIPGGVNSPVRAYGAIGMAPRFIKRADGCHIYDVDDNCYVDYIDSWGPMILGHNFPEIREAVVKACAEGLSFGCATEIEVEMAEFICEHLPHVEMVRMVNSGTEAVMSAIRAARGYTGRDKIIKFAGCYHGHSDALLVSAGSGVMTSGVPDSAGVPKGCTQDTMTAVYNDLDSVKALLEQAKGQVAAVIVEPVAANMGVVAPKKGFLEGLRTLCDQHGTLLIFDEVITGFRLAFGGAAEYFGVTPDMVTYGKIIGAGMPVGAYGGRREIMEMVSPAGPVYQAGTLSGNPIAMAAGLTQLKYLYEHQEVYKELEEKGQKLYGGIEEILKEAGSEYHVNHVSSLGSLFFAKEEVVDYTSAKSSDTKAFADYFLALLEQAKGQVAAVIVEPVAANMGVVAPKKGFLEGLRTLCDQHGTLLIFDEVITGFRLAFGGAAEYFGVTPDMVTYGKIIGAGMPVGAYGGRREIMEMVSPAGPVYQAGTLSGNPIAMAAGLTQLKYLYEHQEVYKELEEKGQKLYGGIEEILKEAGSEYHVNHVSSLGSLFFAKEEVVDYTSAKSSDTKAFADYFLAMLKQGIHLAPSQFEAMFLSTAHSDEVLEDTLTKIRNYFM